MNPNFDQAYALRDSIVFKKEDDGGFLFDPYSGNLKYVNRAAQSILEQIDGRRSLNRILQDLQRRYPDIPADTLREDLKRFFRELIANGFVT